MIYFAQKTSMAANEQNIQPHHCHEMILTFNHLHGEASCTECIAAAKKPKKQLKMSSVAYEKKAKPMDLNAQDFQGSNEETKQINEDPNDGNNFNEIDGDYFNEYDVEDGGAEDFEENFGIEVGEANLALYSKYKNCECCHGMVYTCEGSVCKNLEACYCYMRDLQEGIFVENNMKI